MTTFDTNKSSSITDPQNLPDIPDDELVERYQQLYGGLVNDTLREMGYVHQTLPNDIMPLRDQMCVAGIAFTVRGRKSTETEGEMEQRAQMLESIHPNSVVVWDTHRDDESAHWGEVMTKAAMLAGCRGAIVDGGVRDTHLVLDQNFPVFIRYRSSNGMLGRFRMTDFQKPITIGHVMIYPGDIVFADIDGAIIVPRKLAVQVLLRSEEIRGEEQVYKQWIDDGMSPEEVVKRGGYF
ncbi:MAG TPA: dimethylmenaquinone methyltransferase [Phycisphaerales bacterium]|nr:dimethylmenaquinone methyltransferase [Phycisphaerales bacterium]HCD31834.1 dimethylmenaquinone methyltransferase [Phycisphaerales bacterium]|tara:strand:- start:409 stop:1119 length:711 start_codon:yes stop_codon:yes gene_type:complete